MADIAMTPSILAAQQLTQQSVSVSVIKMAAESQQQVANLLQAAADQPLETSGSVGRNINTAA